MAAGVEPAAAALSLARDGHPVIPLHTPQAAGCSCGQPACSSVGKHPRGGYGLRSATTSSREIELCWATWPEANVGLRCDGLLVVDVDGDRGETSLERLEHELGPLPATREQRTGDGRHLLFRAEQVGNSTRPLGDPPGIDIRGGSHGYIVVPPSLHASGRHYQWADDHSSSPLPPAWMERLRRPAFSAAPCARSIEATTATAYGRAALSEELGRLLRAPVGFRNEHLCRSAFRLGQLVAGGQLPRDQAEHDLHTFGQLTGLELTEVNDVVARALDAGQRSPRTPLQKVKPSRARRKGRV